MWRSAKVRAGAGLVAAVAAVVVAGTIATLAMGGGSTPKPSAHDSATATPVGRPIAATCLRTAPNCNDTKFGSGGDTELTCEQAQACPTTFDPAFATCDGTPVTTIACNIDCRAVPGRPTAQPDGGVAVPACQLCPEPADMSAACRPPACLTPVDPPAATPQADATESGATTSAPGCPLLCSEPYNGSAECNSPSCPLPITRGEPLAPGATPDAGYNCGMPVPPCAIPMLQAPTPPPEGQPCPAPPPPCAIPIPYAPDAAAPDSAPACPPPPICAPEQPPAGPGTVEPQFAPACVAPVCAISSDGVIACPTPGVIAGSAGSSGSGSSGSGIAEPGMPVQISPAPSTAP